jgi:hypothetical protein
MLRTGTLFALLLFSTGSVRAGLFTPDEITAEKPFPFPVREGPGGRVVAEPLPHTLFKIRLNECTEALSDKFPDFTIVKVNGQEKRLMSFKGLARERCNTRLPQAQKLTADELAGLSADLIRLGRGGEAIGLLSPQLRSRTPDYRLVANLVFAHAQREEWDAALDRHGFLLADVDAPKTVPGLTELQLKWLLRLDREAVRSWVQIRRQISLKPTPEQAPGENASPYAIFVDANKKPVEFVNAKGEYEPGQLAPAEKAKLPPDAIAIVQQLALWMPGDSMLLWLLAELYAADGRLHDASDAFEQCTARGLTKPKLLMEHRAAVRSALDRLPAAGPGDLPEITNGNPSPEAEPRPDRGLFDVVSKQQFFVVVGIFGVVVVLLLAMQVRAIRNRRKK